MEEKTDKKTPKAAPKKHLYCKCLAGIVAFFAALILFFLFLLGTTSGQHRLFHWIDSLMSDLHIGQVEGNLWQPQGLKLVDINYQNSSINVHVAQADLQISINDLWRDKTLNIGNVVFKQPVITLLKTTPQQPNKKKEESSGKFTLPFAINVQHVLVNDLQFALPNGDKIALGNFQTALTLNNKTGLTLAPTSIDDLLLDFPKSISKQNKAPKAASQVVQKVENLEKSSQHAPKNEKNYAKKQPKPVDWTAIQKRFSGPLFSLNDFQLPFAIHIESLAGANWTFKQSEKGSDQVVVSEFILKANAQNSDIRLQKLWIKSPIAEVQATGYIKTRGSYPFALTLSGNFTPLSDQHYFNDIGWTHLFLSQPNTLKLVATGQLNGNSTLKLHTTGALDMNVDGQVELTADTMPFTLNIQSPHLQYPFDKTALHPYKFKNVDIQLAGSLIGYKGTIKGLFLGENIKTAPLSAEVSGDMSEVKIAQLDLDVNNQSKLWLKGELSWRNQLKWQSQLKLNNFNLNKYLYPNVAPLAKLKGFDSTLSGLVTYNGFSNFYDDNWAMDAPQISLSGEISHRKFSLDTHFDARPHWVSVPKFDLVYQKNYIKLQGELSEKTHLLMDIDAPDLSGLLPTLQANIKGKVSIDGKGEDLTAHADLKGRNIQFETFKLAQLDLNGNVQDMRTLQGKINLAIRDLDFQKINFSRIDLIANGDEKDHHLTLTSTGNPFALSLKLNGSYKKSLSEWQAVLSTLNLDTPVGKWWIDKPVNMVYRLPDGDARINMSCLLNNRASLCFPRPMQVGKRGEVAFNLKNLNLDILNAFLPQERFLGVVTANGEAKWAPDHAPQVKLNINGRDLHIAQRIDYRYFQVGFPQANIKAELANDTLHTTANVQLYNPYASGYRRYGNIDLALNVDHLQKDRTLSGSANINNVSLSLVKQILSGDENVQGDVFADVHFAGTLANPLLNGKIGVKNARANLKALPFDINNGNVLLALNGQDAKLSGNIKTPQSTLNLNGVARWSSLEQYFGRVNVTAKDFYLNVPLAPSQVEMKVTPNVTAMVTPKDLLLWGNVDIPWARIIIKQLPDNGVSVSPDLIILDGPNKTDERKILALTKGQLDTEGRRMLSRITINIGDDVNLKAYGLDTDLVGTLSLSQQHGILGLYGQINLEKGSFKAYGQNLVIKKGSLGFSGIPGRPMINLDAIRNRSEMIDTDVVAGLRVSGYADKPIIKVYTIPSMSDDQALSYLITGHSLDSNDGTGARDSLSAALLSMSLAQTGSAVSSIGKFFGIQNLNVGTTGTGNKSQVSVSGDITDRLQVRYGVGLFTGLAELTLRLRLLPRLYLQTVSGVNQAVDLFYQFDI
ncbi:autotransporter assembly complex protein TamB [Actinobacillus delphinicola]|uniref:Family of uncharacterized function (DUF490) n=1 Tax=Actinobacillus delphinicola TaxID=51161 RepID=A0A448TTE0_9PAST|nr:translocation/assembly module TamB domain-containing protein [Actinobacillus delphinicola]VEJ09270.1 Family of uncharacterised function (DUF490) [Actinobacillus delphinicola]